LKFLLRAETTKQRRANKIDSPEGANELRICHILLVSIAGEIELLGSWPDAATELQVTEHAVCNVVKMLSIRAVLDALCNVLKVQSTLLQSELADRLSLGDVSSEVSRRVLLRLLSNSTELLG
jgi:hypothetical protein